MLVDDEFSERGQMLVGEEMRTEPELIVIVQRRRLLRQTDRHAEIVVRQVDHLLEESGGVVADERMKTGVVFVLDEKSAHGGVAFARQRNDLIDIFEIVRAEVTVGARVDLIDAVGLHAQENGHTLRRPVDFRALQHFRLHQRLLRMEERLETQSIGENIGAILAGEAHGVGFLRLRSKREHELGDGRRRLRLVRRARAFLQCQRNDVIVRPGIGQAERGRLVRADAVGADGEDALVLAAP